MNRYKFEVVFEGEVEATNAAAALRHVKRLALVNGGGMGGHAPSGKHARRGDNWWSWVYNVRQISRLLKK